MVQMYNIFGRQVGSHWLSLATLASTGALVWWGTSGEKKQDGPAINASSKEEEQFIQEFIKVAEAEDTKAKAKH